MALVRVDPPRKAAPMRDTLYTAEMPPEQRQHLDRLAERYAHRLDDAGAMARYEACVRYYRLRFDDWLIVLGIFIKHERTVQRAREAR